MSKVEYQNKLEPKFLRVAVWYWSFCIILIGMFKVNIAWIKLVNICHFKHLYLTFLDNQHCSIFFR